MSKSYAILANNVDDKQASSLFAVLLKNLIFFFMFKSSGLLYSRLLYAPAFSLAHLLGGGYRSRTDDPLRARQVL